MAHVKCAIQEFFMPFQYRNKNVTAEISYSRYWGAGGLCGACQAGDLCTCTTFQFPSIFVKTLVSLWDETVTPFSVPDESKIVYEAIAVSP